MRAANVLTGAAPFAFPIAQRGEDDHLVSGLPRGIARLMDDPSPIRGDDARRRNPLGAVREPEVEGVDGCRSNGDGNRSRAGLGARTLSDPDPCRSDRFLEDSRPALAQYKVLERLLGHDSRNFTNPPPQRAAGAAHPQPHTHTPLGRTHRPRAPALAEPPRTTAAAAAAAPEA